MNIKGTFRKSHAYTSIITTNEYNSLSELALRWSREHAMLFIIYNLIGVPTRRLVRYTLKNSNLTQFRKHFYVSARYLPNFIDTLTRIRTHLSQNFINKKSTSIKLLFSLYSKLIKKQTKKHSDSFDALPFSCIIHV